MYNDIKVPNGTGDFISKQSIDSPPKKRYRHSIYGGASYYPPDMLINF